MPNTDYGDTNQDEFEMNEMGNQQERFEIDLAWLTGLIEGEGWVSILYYKSNQKNQTYNHY